MVETRNETIVIYKCYQICVEFTHQRDLISNHTRYQIKVKLPDNTIVTYSLPENSKKRYPLLFCAAHLILFGLLFSKQGYALSINTV